MISKFSEHISEQEVSRFQSLKRKGHGVRGRKIFRVLLSPAESCHGAVVFKRFLGVQTEKLRLVFILTELILQNCLFLVLFYGVQKGNATEKRRKQVVVSGWEELEMWGELRTWRSPTLPIWEMQPFGKILERQQEEH